MCPIHDFYTFLLVFARVGGLMTAAPLFSNHAIPRQVRVGFTLIFSLALVPLVAPHTGPIPDSLPVLAGGVLKDALFGMSLGYLARVLFSCVEMAGYFVDTQIGFGFINLINPFSEQQASLLSGFQYQLAVTVFLLADGHHALLGALYRSCLAVPPGAIAIHGAFGLAMGPMLKLMFLLGLQMALPATAVLLMVDVGLGLIARMVPQINVFIVGLPAKIILGLMTVALLLPIMSIVVGHIIAGTETGLNALVAAAK